LGCIVERTKVEFEFSLEQIPISEPGRLGLNFTENGRLAIHECCTSKVRDGVLDFGASNVRDGGLGFGGACLEGGQSVSKVEHTLQEESSQLSLIRAVVSVQFFDFSSGFVLARFREVRKNLPHQHVVREVIKTLGIAIIWVVLGRLVVARIARRVGVAFWVAS
jgi:hypothetical protein